MESSGFLETNEAWNNLGASFGALDQVMAPFPGFGPEPLEPVPAALGDEEGPSGQEIADNLVAELFSESNYEGDGNYAIPGSMVCPDVEVWDEQNPDGFSYEVDQECLDGLAALELRIHVETAGDGLDFDLLVGPGKASAMMEAGRWYGLRARAVSLEVDALRNLPKGAILYWEVSHYVIYERMTRDYVEVIDPGLGRRQLPWKQFRKAFTGVALIFEPSEDFQPGGAKARPLWPLFMDVVSYASYQYNAESSRFEQL